jgi:hypothetical protein
MQSYKNFFIYARKIVIYNDSKLEKFNTFFLVGSIFFCRGKNLTFQTWSDQGFFVWGKKIKFFCVFQFFFVYGNKCSKIDFKPF